MTVSVFENRTTSSFGVSIGTGLALETLFDPTEERYDKDRTSPDGSKVMKFGTHIYNVYTIARNILSAIPGTDKSNHLTNRDLKLIVAQELSQIVYLYEDTKIALKFYMPDYTAVMKKLNKNKDAELRSTYLDYSAMKSTLAGLDLGPNKWEPVASSKPTLIFTGYVADLLLITTIPELTLLESHTGKVKTKSEFNTKYGKVGKNDLSHLPFLDIILYILGDKTFSKPARVGVKRELYQLSISKKWTPKTTRTKVIVDMRSNDSLKETLKGFI